MKVKLFIRDKGLSRWARFAQALEEEINAWLAENPEIRIVDIRQSSNGGSFDSTKVIISVWYEEG